MADDVEAALERLRNAWDRYANGYDIGIKHPSEAIERHIEAQSQEIERLKLLAAKRLIVNVRLLAEQKNFEAEIARLEAIVQHFAEDTCGWGDAVRDELDTYVRTPVCSYCGGASQHSYRYPHPEGWTPTQGGTDAPR